MADKYVNRAVDVVMTVRDDAPLCKLPEGEVLTHCKVFTLTDRRTGAFVEVDQFMLDFLHSEAQREI
jgi:hypothetical protein